MASDILRHRYDLRFHVNAIFVKLVDVIGMTCFHVNAIFVKLGDVIGMTSVFT